MMSDDIGVWQLANIPAPTFCQQISQRLVIYLNEWGLQLIFPPFAFKSLSLLQNLCAELV